MNRVISASLSALASLFKGRSYRKAPRLMKYWSKTTCRHVMLALLITQLLVPMPFAYAPDPVPDPTTPEGMAQMGLIPEGIPPEEINRLALEHASTIIDGIARAGQETARHNVAAVQRNIALMLDQHIVDLRTGEEWDLTVTNLRRPAINVAPGVVERSLLVEPLTNGVLLKLPGARYGHRIRFGATVDLVDYDWDDTRIELLTSDGMRHQIEVSSLGPTKESDGLLYNASVPVMLLGKVRTVAGQPANRVHIIARRVDPQDKSRSAQEARLDRNPKHIRRLEWIADQGLVTRLEENLEMVRPVPLHPELEKFLKATSPDGKVWHDAGDVAIGYHDGKTEVMVGKESAVLNAALVGLQMGPLFGLWTLASPDSARAVREMRDLRGSGQEAVAQILSDPTAFDTFYRGGVQRALSRLPAPALNNMHASVNRIIARQGQAAAQGTPDAVRDRFTQEDWEGDFTYFEGLVETARRTATRAGNRSYLNPLRYNTFRRFAEWGDRQLQGIRQFDLPKRVRQACAVLKRPVQGLVLASGLAAVAAGGDYMVTHGQNVQAAVNTMGQLWSHTVDYVVPIAKTPGYVWDMVRFSMTARMAILLSVFAVAWLARPFCQHGVNKLITITGIKYLFSITIIPPQRALAILTGRSRLVDAMKLGYFPWRFLMPLGAQRNASIDLVSADIDHKNRLRSLSTALAIHCVAQREGIDPLVLLQEMVKKEGGVDPKVRVERARGLAIALSDCFINGTGRNLGQALVTHPADFAQTIHQARTVAAGLLAQRGDRTGAGAMPFLRCVVGRSVAMGVGWFGEAKYRNLLNPQPPQDFSDYVARSYLIDGLLTFVVSSFSGKFANPATPDLLAYQPGVPGFNTHEFLIVNDFEQTALHLGASAANDYLSAGYEGHEAFAAYRPAGLMDEDRVRASRSFWQDGLSILGLLLNVRRNNYLVGFGVRSWTQCVTLLQGFFIIGMVLRLFEDVIKGEPLGMHGWTELWDKFGTQDMLNAAGNTFVHATVGQSYFIYVAPFVYRWFWAVALTTTRSLQAEINRLGGDFKDRFAQFQVAVRTGDEAKAMAEAQQMITLYDKKVRGVPKEVLDSVKPVDGEAPMVWAARVLEACRTAPPVPEVTNETANKAIVYVGGVATTILAMKLMVDSFDKRPFWGKDNAPDSWGFDTADWNMWDGVSRHDSVPAIMVKSLLNVGAIWGAGHIINIGVDAARLAMASRYLASAKNSNSPVDVKAAEQQRDAAVTDFGNSVNGLFSMPGLGFFAPAQSTLNTTAAVLDARCVKAITDAGEEEKPRRIAGEV